MHQSFAQRRAILEGLRQRRDQLAAEVCANAGLLAPIIMPRFNVIPNGDNQFGIVERSTGTVREVCTGHNAACRAAQQLETMPESKPGFATYMLRWTVGFCVILALFAAYGAQP